MGVGHLASERSAGRAVTLLADTTPPVSPDEVVQVMGRTLADALAQPLTQLLVTLDLWEAGRYAGEPPAVIRERLQQVGDELVRRFERLARASSYTPRVRGGFVILDLD